MFAASERRSAAAPRVSELSALYESVLRTPVRAAGVCRTCLTFTTGHDQCSVCSRTAPWLDAVLPISYSVAGEQLHRALVTYKRAAGAVAWQTQVQLAAVLWRFLEHHERCVAEVTGTAGFGLVTSVPPRWSHPTPDPLAHITGSLCGLTHGRYERLLRTASIPFPEHEFDARTFEPLRSLTGQDVLLIDDTWTTGATAQSAAAALKRAGAGRVGLVVLGRFVKRDWSDNDRRLSELPPRFNWQRCASCTGVVSLGSATVCRPP